MCETHWRFIELFSNKQQKNDWQNYWVEPHEIGFFVGQKKIDY